MLSHESTKVDVKSSMINNNNNNNMIKNIFLNIYLFQIIYEYFNSNKLNSNLNIEQTNTIYLNCRTYILTHSNRSNKSLCSIQFVEQ